MKATIFTSNQPRHLSLVEKVASIAEEVWVVQEAKKNPVSTGDSRVEMARYMGHMIDAEHAVFGRQRFLSPDINQYVLAMGDLSHVDIKLLAPCLDSDLYIVFGASYIRGPLVDFLIANHCINIHMGLSPYYRGSACNFWALWDRKPEYVGATLHLLSAGLDSGPILCHALPETNDTDGFLLGMRAVDAAFNALTALIGNRTITSLVPVPQDRAAQVRYSRAAEFTPEIAASYLDQRLDPSEIGIHLRNPDPRRQLIRPRYG